MLQTVARISLVVLALGAPSRELTAQQGTAPRQTSTRAAAPTVTAAQREMQGWYVELQQIGARLAQAHARAMQDPGLRARQETLAEQLKVAMFRVDPSLRSVEARARALEGEARAARQAGDEARMTTLMEQAGQIEMRILEAQKAVMGDAAMAARMTAFEADLRKKMTEVEPQTPQLVERAESLQRRLMAAMQQLQRR